MGFGVKKYLRAPKHAAFTEADALRLFEHPKSHLFKSKKLDFKPPHPI